MKRLYLFLIFVTGLTGVSLAAKLDAKMDGEKFFHKRQLMEILPDMPEKLSDKEVKYWGEDASYEIENYYHQSGFFNVKVDATVEKKIDASNWTVTFHVSEGTHFRFGKVRISVEDDSTVALTVEKLKAHEGDFYVEEDLSLDQRQITRVLGNAGFVHARVEEQSDQKDSTINILYQVKRGHAAVFDTLIINVRRVAPADSLEGLTQHDLLQSLVPYKRGDTLRIDQNDKVIEKLQSTGIFNLVRLDDSTLDDNNLDEAGGRSALILNVEENVPGHATASLFYETDYGFGVATSIVHNNVAGSMKEVRGGIEFAQHKQSFSAGFGSPLLWGLLLRFDNNSLVEWYQDQLPGYNMFSGDYHMSNTSSLSRTFTHWLRGVSSLQLDYLNQLVADTGVNTGLLSRQKIGTLDLINTAFFSFVDQDLNPARGTRFALTWGNGGSVDDGLGVFTHRDNWLEVKSAYYYYLPPWDQFKTAFRIDGGRFFGDGGANSNIFFLGGPRSIRSYEFEQLCPDQPSPSVGSCQLLQDNLEPAYFLLSAELRLSPFDFSAVQTRGVIKYLKPLGVVPFVDYGKVWNLRGSEHFALTHDFLFSGYGHGFAYGGGLRYPLLGIFDFRLDFAWGRPGGGNWPDEWLIDLGEAF